MLKIVNFLILAFFSLNVVSSQIQQATFDDFKALMMFFNEPVLKSAAVKDFEIISDEGTYSGDIFEGSTGTFMASKLCAAIQNLRSTKGSCDDSLIEFQKYLNLGYKFLMSASEEIEKDKENKKVRGVNSTFSKDFSDIAKQLQELLLDYFEGSDTIIIPFGWSGKARHAIAFILKQHPGKLFFDLTVVNTGDGAQYHYKEADPNNVYPALHKLWIKFKNIPKSEIFNESTHWFMYMFFSFWDLEKISKIEKVSGSVAHYFYHSVLNNFSSFVDSTDFNNEKLYNLQRSGSCALSSLMAAYLNFAKNETEFLKNKVLIGHQMLEDFRSHYKDNNEIKMLITDSFDLSSRKLWKSTISAISHQLLAYLEKEKPDLFCHAGLIGSFRPIWVSENKTLAIAFLKSNPDILKLLKTSIELGTFIIDYLKENPIRKTSSLIKIDDKVRNYAGTSFKFHTSNVDSFGVLVQHNFQGFLNEPIKRPALKSLSNSESIINQLKICALKNENEVLTCVLDLLNVSNGKTRWWDIFENEKNSCDSKLYLDCMKTCVDILKKYMIKADLPDSLDDIVSLTHIQIALWKSAVLYDRRKSVDKLNLSAFKIPNIIGKIIDNKPLITSHEVNHWRIVTNFSSSNVQELRILLSAMYRMDQDTMSLMKQNRKVMTAIHSLIPDGQIFNAVFANIKLGSDIFDPNVILLRTILNHSQLSKLIENKRKTLSENSGGETGTDWLIQDYSKTATLVTILDQVELFFPHFVYLLEGMIYIHERLKGNPITFKDKTYPYPFEKYPHQPSSVNLNLEKNSKPSFNFSSYHVCDPEKPFINSCSVIKLNEDTNDIFYRLRHSQACHNNIASFESWLNYVLSSQDAAIFDSVYFLYLSDRILNMPHLSLQGSSYSGIQIKAIEYQYPKHFSKHHIKIIFRSLHDIICNELNYLIDRNTKLSLDLKSKILQRTLNIAVILVRFIGRIDFDKHITGENTSIMLASVYKSLYRFGSLLNELHLEEELISSVNIVLTQICDIPIRNPRTFLLRVAEVLPGKKMIPFRKSLARTHWFIAKMFYAPLNPGKNLLDDIFLNGFKYYPVSRNEIPFMNILLLSHFATKNVLNHNLPLLSYHESGDQVKIDIGSLRIYAQLSSGKVIRNGDPVIKKNLIFTSDEFKSYFSKSDQAQAINGDLTIIGQYYIYVVSDFRINGNTIVLLCTSNSCSVYKNYRNNWYIWRKDLNNFYNCVKYTSLDNHKMYEKNTNNPEAAEVIIMKDVDTTALLTITPANDSEFANDIFFNSRISMRQIEHLFTKIQIGNFIKNDWVLLNYDSTIDKNLKRHLRHFTNTKIHLAKSISNNALVIIYADLRLKEKPDFPLVLLESVEKSLGVTEFRVLNNPGIIVESSQIAFSSIGISGTLVVRNEEGQRYILAPSYKNDDQAFTTVERIPIVDNLPAPQTRFHRLLLAYYCTKAREYDYARELMHPTTSINQNEVFSAAYFAVIKLIVEIEGGGPEADSIKLMAYTHTFINSTKFPLEYLSDKESTSDEKSFRAKKIEEIQKLALQTKLNSYLMGIREIPEKYYLHHIFPEFTSERHLQIVKQYLKMQENFPAEELLYVKMEPSHFGSESDYFTDISFDRISVERLYCILRDISSEYGGSNLFSIYPNTESPLKRKLKKYLETAAKYVHRDRIEDENRISTLNDNEAVVLCAQFDPAKFKRAAELFLEIKNSSKLEVKTKMLIEFEKELKSVLDACKHEHREIFMKFNASEGSSQTDTGKLFETLRNDAKIASKLKNHKEIDVSFTIVNQEDVDNIAKLISIVKTLVKSDKNKTQSGLDLVNVNKSIILKKLEKSIFDYIESHGQYTVYEMDLTSNVELWENMKFVRIYLESRLDVLQGISFSLISKLSSMVMFNDSKEAHLLDSVNRFMHDRKLKTFQNLYSCYQKLSIPCIQNTYPQLDLIECETILKDTAEYYSIQVLRDYFEMILDIVEKFIKSIKKNENILIDDLNIFLDEAAKVSNFNERLKQPSILNFEYRSKRYRLREEQVKDITLLAELDEDTNSFKSIVIQRMMAAGKTLVLGTISVVKKALNSSKLSILVPPSSLYQSNLSSMQTRTNSYFNTIGHSLTFPRIQSGNDDQLEKILIPFLELFLENIKYIKSHNDYYVLSPDSLQSFLNSYIEIINHINSEFSKMKEIKNSYTIALGLFAEIYNIFRTQGSIILDEIDMTMDPKKELNFPTTEHEAFNMIAATLSTDLIEFSLFDKNIINSGLDIIGNNQSAFTEANYETRYKKALLDYIKTNLDDAYSIWSDLLIDSKQGNYYKNQIHDFLSNKQMEYKRGWIDALHRANLSEIADALVIIKMQIHQGFKEAFKSTANLNFGAAASNRPTVQYAVPYLAANTPSPSSEFSDRWETLNKTLLMLSASKCPDRIAKNIIPYIQQRIVKECDGGISPEDTTTHRNFKTLIPYVDILALNSQNEDALKIIHEALNNRSPAAIRLLFSYALDEIFNEMRFPVEQITSNALNMTSMFESVQGYSGTIDNVNILPVNVVSQAWVNHMENEKNNGAIALKLIKDSRSAEGVFQMTDKELKGSASEMISLMFSQGPPKSAKNQVSALIDTGAFFKKFKNEDVAAAILENLKPRINAVLYYDEESNQIKFIRKSGNDTETGYIFNPDPDSIFKATQTDISKRFTFYDQRHITGSDILQPKTSHALMTIGTRVLLRDILQGTLRMRQFMSSQKVHLITSTSAAQFYFSKAFPLEPIENFKDRHVSVSDMIALGAFNEDDKQLVENRKLGFAKIDNEVRRFVLESITREVLDNPTKVFAVIYQWFLADAAGGRNIRDLFVRTIRENPRSWLVKHKDQPTSLVMKRYTAFWADIMSKKIKIINEIITDYELKTSSQFQALNNLFELLVSDDQKAQESKQSLLAFLEPKMVDFSEGDSVGGEVEMQLQVFSQTLAQADVDVYLDVIKTCPPHEKRIAFKLSHTETNKGKTEITCDQSSSIVRLDSIMFDSALSNHHKTLTKNILTTTGQAIGISKDLVLLVQSPPPYKIFSKYTWEGSHILVQRFKNMQDIRVFLLSEKSAEEVLATLSADDFTSPNSDFWVCDLSGNITFRVSSILNPATNILDIVPKAKNLIFDVLVFNGSLNHILAWEDMKIIYEKWLKDESRSRNRAKFLLLRMKLLADKAANIFSLENPDIINLNRVANGQQYKLEEAQKAFGLFRKPPVCKLKEDDYYKDFNISRPSETKSLSKRNVSFETILSEITGESVAESVVTIGLSFGALPNETIQEDNDTDEAKDPMDLFDLKKIAKKKEIENLLKPQSSFSMQFYYEEPEVTEDSDDDFADNSDTIADQEEFDSDNQNQDNLESEGLSQTSETVLNEEFDGSHNDEHEEREEIRRDHEEHGEREETDHQTGQNNFETESVKNESVADNESEIERNKRSESVDSERVTKDTSSEHDDQEQDGSLEDQSNEQKRQQLNSLSDRSEHEKQPEEEKKQEENTEKSTSKPNSESELNENDKTESEEDSTNHEENHEENASLGENHENVHDRQSSEDENTLSDTEEQTSHEESKDGELLHRNLGVDTEERESAHLNEEKTSEEASESEEHTLDEGESNENESIHVNENNSAGERELVHSNESSTSTETELLSDTEEQTSEERELVHEDGGNTPAQNSHEHESEANNRDDREIAESDALTQNEIIIDQGSSNNQNTGSKNNLLDDSRTGDDAFEEDDDPNDGNDRDTSSKDDIGDKATVIVDDDNSGKDNVIVAEDNSDKDNEVVDGGTSGKDNEVVGGGTSGKDNVIVDHGTSGKDDVIDDSSSVVNVKPVKDIKTTDKNVIETVVTDNNVTNNRSVSEPSVATNIKTNVTDPSVSIINPTVNTNTNIPEPVIQVNNPKCTGKSNSGKDSDSNNLNNDARTQLIDKLPKNENDKKPITAPTDATKKNQNIFIFIAIGLLIIIVAGVGIYLFLSSRNANSNSALNDTANI